MNTLYGVSYPIAIHENTQDNDGFELAAIKHAFDEGIDEFVLLQDSIEIKDKNLFDMVFSLKSFSVSLCNYPYYFGCYLGKYRLKTLEKITISQIKTKSDAVEYEQVFTRQYVANEPNLNIFFPGFGVNTGKIVMKLGEKRMVLENNYYTKYKGTWHRDMIHD